MLLTINFIKDICYNNALEYVKKVAVDLENQYIFIMHSNREEYANDLKEKFEMQNLCKKVFVSDVFSGCGTNIGPGMVCVYFFGDQVTTDLQKEKEALLSAIEQL